jgi:AcrR family transcriptional regulator
MKNKPDTPRRYNSQSRRARAAETKQRILDVARALFGERGLDAVTIDELSAAAGVSSPTVYALFGSKVGILKALIDSARRQNQRDQRPDRAVADYRLDFAHHL